MRTTLQYDATILAVIPLALTMTLSCAIKEDREECPSILSIRLTEARERVLELASDGIDVLVRNSGDFRYDKSISRGEIPELLEIRSPKGSAQVAAFACNGNMKLHSGILMLPIGHEADVLWGYCSDIDCSMEESADTVILHKQFCTVDVTISGLTPDNNCFIRMEGDWNGMDPYALTPVKGPFNTLAQNLPFGGFRVRVPRQGDSSLRMMLMEQTASGSGKLIKEYDLGDMMEAYGYDWSADDLDDISINIEYATLSLEITIMDWAGGGAEDYII